MQSDNDFYQKRGVSGVGLGGLSSISRQSVSCKSTVCYSVQREVSSSRPVVVVDAFVVLETAVNLPRFPVALVVEYICEYVEVALVERDPTISVIGDVDGTPEIVVDLPGSRILVDR